MPHIKTIVIQPCYTQRHGRSRANGDVENIIMMRLGIF